jgi:hypothetical protein
VQVLTPALRACLDAADHQSMRFADVSEATLCAAVDASVESLKQQLIAAHRQVNKARRAQAQLQEALGKEHTETGKFFIRKMATGTIDDFHKGLQDRIGEFAEFFLFIFVYHFMSRGRGYPSCCCCNMCLFCCT